VAALRLEPRWKLYPDLVAWVGVISCALLAVSLPLITILLGTALLAARVIGRAALRKAERRDGS
jgi:hypothetical protein